MKRYIKPQIEILNTNLSEDMLQTASSQEPAEVGGVWPRKIHSRLQTSSRNRKLPCSQT